MSGVKGVAKGMRCGIIELSPIKAPRHQICSISREGILTKKFTAVFEQEGEWWIGYVEELSGANTQGQTLKKVRQNLKEAVQLIIEANRELARRETEGKKE